MPRIFAKVRGLSWRSTAMHTLRLAICGAT
jgi:hypothetical protein